MIPIEIIHKVYNGTCSLGVITTPSPDDIVTSMRADAFHILGTGFLSRYSTVVTNRHVADAMNQFLATHNLSDDRLAAQFNYFTGDYMEQCYAPVTKFCIVRYPPEDDIALLTIERLDDDPEDFKEAVQPLAIVPNVNELDLGQEIGIVGFPYGASLHVDPHSQPNQPANVVRLGPVLHQGFLSGFRPWKRTHGIREVFLDARIAGGMSGSPVFWQQTGTVVGVVYSTHESVVGRAVPIDAVRVAGWAKMLDEGQTEIVVGEIRYED
jgi:hypothetical protein